ncbi:MAG TPA: hypothetical protein VFI83_03925 [Gaiella sp.]|nr:hypothetical protein [Gaiella sp.]
MATYVFVDEWFVPADPQWVYDLLSCPREYPAWWDDVFLRGEGDPGPAAPGKRARLVTRGRLPYRLRWELVGGEGIWTITGVEGGTRVVLEWTVEVRKPLVRRLTPLLRPIFGWNHRWAMKRGERRIVTMARARG